MKAHLKALSVTIGICLALIGIYNFFIKAADKPAVEKTRGNEKIFIPDQQLTLLDGKVLSVKQFAGKVIIFNFWASWCAPCIEEVPSLVSLVKDDPNIVIIAVSGDQNKDDIMAFLKSFPGFNKPPIYVVQENMKMLMEHFKVDKLPESFIFNPKGEMVKKISGTINWHTPDSIEYFKVIRAK